MVDEASAPAPPPVFDAGVALAPVLVLLDVAVEELLLVVVLDEVLATSLLDGLVPVSVHFNSPLSHQDGFDHTVNGVRIRISGHTVVIA